jgi:hypothetical protein
VNKVWVVETGEYSDYQVRAIFAEENQQMATDFARGFGVEPTEWTLDTWTQEQGEWRFDFDFAGNIVGEEFTPNMDPVPDEPGPVQANAWNAPEISIRVYRGEREHALKIAADRFLRIRAFLDEAIERCSRAKFRKIYKYGTALRVALILAGLGAVPDPPRCGHDADVLEALGVKLG